MKVLLLTSAFLGLVACSNAPTQSGASGTERDVGGGVLMSFEHPLVVRQYPMPHGATNFRVLGNELKVGITGVPTGKPKESSDFVLKQLETAKGQYTGTGTPVVGERQAFSSTKFNAAYVPICSGNGDKTFHVFADASFSCVTTAILSADNMVLLISVGSNSLESADYKVALKAIREAH